MPPEYHQKINTFIDINQLSFKLDASVSHNGCASEVNICCENGHEFGCKAKNRPVKGKKGKGGKVYKRAKLSIYKGNVSMLLVQYVMGVGGEEIQQFLTLLNFPHGKNFTINSLLQVGADVGVVLHDVMDACMNKAIMEEIKATLDEKHNNWKNIYFFDPKSADPEPLSYEKKLEIPNSNHPKVPIIVSFDTGWQKRGHSSISGHTFVIGAQTKKYEQILCVQKNVINARSQQQMGGKLSLILAPETMRAAARQCRQMLHLNLPLECIWSIMLLWKK
eukprot:718153-Ditylum_brightwellii.AAC.1